MMNRNSLSLVVIITATGLLMAGCSAQKDGAPAATADSTAQHHADDHDHAHNHDNGDGHDHDDAAMTADKSEIEAAMAKLSPADRKLAEEQKICPVSDEPLGSMGTPIKVTVEGRDIFVCCEGCVDALKEDFDKYAAKLGSESSQQ